MVPWYDLKRWVKGKQCVKGPLNLNRGGRQKSLTARLLGCLANKIANLMGSKSC